MRHKPYSRAVSNYKQPVSLESIVLGTVISLGIIGSLLILAIQYNIIK
jgi:hypothetical protein